MDLPLLPQDLSFTLRYYGMPLKWRRSDVPENGSLSEAG